MKQKDWLVQLTVSGIDSVYREKVAQEMVEAFGRTVEETARDVEFIKEKSKTWTAIYFDEGKFPAEMDAKAVTASLARRVWWANGGKYCDIGTTCQCLSDIPEIPVRLERRDFDEAMRCGVGGELRTGDLACYFPYGKDAGYVEVLVRKCDDTAVVVMPTDTGLKAARIMGCEIGEQGLSLDPEDARAQIVSMSRSKAMTTAKPRHIR